MGNIENKIIKGKNLLIISNILDLNFFKKLQEQIFSEKIGWFFRENMTLSKDNSFFSHSFFDKFLPYSEFYIEYIIPIINELRFVALSEVRANLMIRKEKIYKSNFHIDRDYPSKTAILYLNTCNGYTVFDEEEQFKIMCEENKVVIFDSQISHSAVSQTDTERRIVINFNGF